jgi:hypothetical protein
MSVSEQDRHDLYETFIQVFGRKEAGKVMDLLPPVDWSDVARRSDVEALGVRWSDRMDALDATWTARMDAQDATWSARMDAFDAKMDALENRLLRKTDELRAEFFKSQEARTRLVVFGMITMVVVVAALAFGAARLA